MSFDVKIGTSSGSLYNKDYLVRISGKGAVAQIRPADSVLILPFNQWHTHSFLIDSSVWDMVSGNWDSLILSVDEVRLELEFIGGTEVASFDNFCLIPKAREITDLIKTELLASIVLFPNPAPGAFTFNSPQATIQSLPSTT